MAYADLMLAAVPSGDKAAYTAFCERMGAVFRRHGATGTADIWGNDIPEGKLTSGPSTSGSGSRCRW